MNDMRRQPLVWQIGSPDAPPRKTGAASAMSLAARYCAFAAESVDQQAVSDEACRVAVKGLDADYAGLLQYDPCNKDFLVVAGVGWKPGVVGRSRLKAVGKTALGLVWNMGDCVVSNRVDDDDRCLLQDMLIERYPSRRIDVRFPCDGEGAFGVMEVGSSKSGWFTPDDGDFVRVLAHGMAWSRRRTDWRGKHLGRTA